MNNKKNNLGELDIDVSNAIPSKVMPPKAQVNLGETGPILKIRDYLDEDGKIQKKKIQALGKIKVTYVKEDKKRLQMIGVSSYRNPRTGEIFGYQYKDKDDKTKLGRYNITKPETPLDLKKDYDYNMFLALMTEPFVYGSLNQRDDIFFKIVSLAKEKETKLKTTTAFAQAVRIVNEATEEQRKNLCILVGVPTLETEADDLYISLMNLAKENPEVIVNVSMNDDNETILMIHAAITNGVLKEQSGMYLYNRYELGSSVESIRRYLKQNASIYAMIKQEVEG